MARYVVRRLLSAIPTLFLVVVLAFFLVRAAPGGPFDEERALPPAVAANIEAYYHLDEPLPAQLGRYLAGLLKGDLGPSYRYRDRTVNDIIAETFPVSFQIGALAMLAAVIVGTALGAYAALHANTLRDRVVTGIAMTGISIPVFVVAPVLVLFFAVRLGWLPAGWSGAGEVRRLVLPVIALALPQIAYVTRLT